MSLELFFLHASGAATVILIVAAVLARAPENASLAAILAIVATATHAALLGGGPIASVALAAIHAPIVLAALLGTRAPGAPRGSSAARLIVALVVGAAFALLGFQASTEETTARARPEISKMDASRVDDPSRVPLAALAITAWCVFAASVAVRRRRGEDGVALEPSVASRDENEAPRIVERTERWIASRDDEGRFLDLGGREARAP